MVDQDYWRNYYQKNKERILEYSRKYYGTNKEIERKRDRDRYKRNKEKIQTRSRERYRSDSEYREKHLQYSEKWRRKHRAEVRRKNTERTRIRYQTDPEYREKKLHDDAERREKREAQYKSLVLSELGGKCSKCGFNDDRILEVHHIDKNGTGKVCNRWLKAYREDRSRQLLLCPNCHRLLHVIDGDFRRRKRVK